MMQRMSQYFKYGNKGKQKMLTLKEQVRRKLNNKRCRPDLGESTKNIVVSFCLLERHGYNGEKEIDLAEEGSIIRGLRYVKKITDYVYFEVDAAQLFDPDYLKLKSEELTNQLEAMPLINFDYHNS